MDTATFSASIVATLLTGRGFGDTFTAVHEAAKHVAGHPIWMHEFAERGLWDSLRAAMVARFPALAAVEHPADWKTGAAGYLDGVRAICGESVTLERGSAERTESPLDSLRRVAPDAEAIAVDTGRCA